MHTYCGKIIMHKQKMIVNIVATQFNYNNIEMRIAFLLGD